MVSLGNFKKFLIYLVVFLIPFNIKKFLFSFNSSFPISISYSSAFLYICDLLVLILFLLSLKDLTLIFSFSKVFYVFPIFGFLSVFKAINVSSFFFSFFHLILFSFFGSLCSFLIYKKEISLDKIFLFLGISSVFQSIWGILQFRNQASLGAKFLGESVLNVETQGVARVFTEGGNFLRVYGTMPHANILAAFLFLGAMSFLYLFFKSGNFLFLVSSFLPIFSTFLTFSRSGILALFLGVLSSVVYGLVHQNLRRKAVFLCGALFVFALALYLILGNLLTARFYLSKSEPSFFYRVNYNLIGISLFLDSPFLGVGLGNQIEKALSLKLYQKQNLVFPWQWQPIHNIYLLVLAETGVLGFAAFLFFLFSILKKPFVLLYKNFCKRELLNIFFPFVICFLFLILGLVDHFFWDLESGLLMFFLILGIIKGESEKNYDEKQN